jgi:hypothetical protein
MVIRPVVVDRKPAAAHLLSFSKSGVTLSAKFVKDKDLTSHEGIVFYKDDEDDYWLGFKTFEENDQSDSLGLVSTSSSANRYVKAAEVINKTPVLANIRELEFKKDRSFEIQWDKANKLWFIRLRPVFERSVLWADKQMIPDDVLGIYRYWGKDGDLLYIGKGWIKARTNSPERQAWSVHKIEFSILRDEAESLRWESFYIDEHKNRYGVLPPYNRIGGHSQ